MASTAKPLSEGMLFATWQWVVELVVVGGGHLPPSRPPRDVFEDGRKTRGTGPAWPGEYSPCAPALVYNSSCSVVYISLSLYLCFANLVGLKAISLMTSEIETFTSETELMTGLRLETTLAD